MDNHLHLTAGMKSKAKKMTQREDVRVHRPVDLRKSRWILGDIVEVFYQNLWRPGKIIKALKNDYFIIRLTCLIQLKEFHISCLRVPQANHGKQSTVIDKDCRGFEEEGHRPVWHRSSKICPSTATRVVKKPKARRMRPDDFIILTGKKTKATAHEVRQPIKNVLPLKVLRKPECEALSSSKILLHAREKNECSVASCSANCEEYSINDNQQSVELDSCFPEDAISTCPMGSSWETNNVYGPSLGMNLHDLELHAYQSTVRAFYALGPLTWEQESLLTNLRLSLNISNEEHLLQLRHLLST